MTWRNERSKTSSERNLRSSRDATTNHESIQHMEMVYILPTPAFSVRSTEGIYIESAARARNAKNPSSHLYLERMTSVSLAYRLSIRLPRSTL